jgi:hypothetical protein
MGSYGHLARFLGPLRSGELSEGGLPTADQGKSARPAVAAGLLKKKGSEA